MSLTTISADIFDTIISFFPSDDNGDLKTSTLVSLARVHSSLLVPSQRHIFRKISLGTTFSSLTYCRHEKREHRYSQQKLEKRLNALISSPHLIGYIRNLTLGPMILQEYTYNFYSPLQYDVQELIKLFDKDRSQVTKLTLRGAKPTHCDWSEVQSIAVTWLREVLLPTTQEFRIFRLSGVDLGALSPACIQLRCLVILNSTCSQLTLQDIPAFLEKSRHLMKRKEPDHSFDSVWVNALEGFLSSREDGPA
ncbi:hypothetical protein DL96DRAFT_218218 [Flagelloscypha sp. PMI_526]|nr:hypothetical protein DL96DRAFT_218218 [Flagelloscypha sp. PMI_526]